MSSGGRVGLFTCNVTTGTSLFDFTSLMIILFLGMMCVVGGGLFGFLLGGEGGYSLTTWIMDLALRYDDWRNKEREWCEY